jgi:hypothetical protein
LIIGCGSYQPIEQYITNTSSPYPVYANPSLSLYKAFEFKSSFTDKAKDDPEKDYMVGQGSTVSRVLGGVKRLWEIWGISEIKARWLRMVVR